MHRMLIVALATCAIAGSALGVRAWLRAPAPAPAEERTWVEVEEVRSGDRIEVEPDDEVVYAGIRAPLPGEPLYKQARDRNAELVEGKELRLRFDAAQRDKKQRLVAYAYAGEVFVNETLVREGLAWVRLTDTTRRCANELLAAQQEARQKQRGVWKTPWPASGPLQADPKYGVFHTPACSELAKIKPERLQHLADAQAAFGQGFAPCAACCRDGSPPADKP